MQEAKSKVRILLLLVEVLGLWVVLSFRLFWALAQMVVYRLKILQKSNKDNGKQALKTLIKIPCLLALLGQYKGYIF